MEFRRVLFRSWSGASGTEEGPRPSRRALRALFRVRSSAFYLPHAEEARRAVSKHEAAPALPAAPPPAAKGPRPSRRRFAPPQGEAFHIQNLMLRSRLRRRLEA